MCARARGRRRGGGPRRRGRGTFAGRRARAGGRRRRGERSHRLNVVSVHSQASVENHVIPWKYTRTFFTLLLPNQCACVPLGKVMLSGAKPLSFAYCRYVGVVATFRYRSWARLRFPSWVRNMANMTSLNHVLEPFAPLKGDVMARPDAEPTAGCQQVGGLANWRTYQL